MDSQNCPECENTCEPHNSPLGGIYPDKQFYMTICLWMSVSQPLLIPSTLVLAQWVYVTIGIQAEQTQQQGFLLVKNNSVTNTVECLTCLQQRPLQRPQYGTVPQTNPSASGGDLIVLDPFYYGGKSNVSSLEQTHISIYRFVFTAYKTPTSTTGQGHIECFVSSPCTMNNIIFEQDTDFPMRAVAAQSQP